MLNASTSLVSEMIGQDDDASAIVFACLNIVESFSNGYVVFFIMSNSLQAHEYSLKIIIGIMPIFCACGAYLISWWRFRNAAKQFYAVDNVAKPTKKEKNKNKQE